MDKFRIDLFNKEEGFRVSGTGNSFGESAADLLKTLATDFCGDLEFFHSILIGLASLVDPEKDSLFEDYSEWDFSDPEGAFTITVQSDGEMIPKSRKDAASRIMPLIGKDLSKVSRLDFLKAWNSIAYLHGGLHPDDASRKAEQTTMTGEFDVDEILFTPYDSESGWPTSLIPFVEFAWHLREEEELDDDQMYPVDANKAGQCS
jgi:hypothetical protein